MDREDFICRSLMLKFVCCRVAGRDAAKGKLTFHEGFDPKVAEHVFQLSLIPEHCLTLHRDTGADYFGHSWEGW